MVTSAKAILEEYVKGTQIKVYSDFPMRTRMTSLAVILMA